MKTVIGLVLLMVSGQVSAGWYAGVGLGGASVDIESSPGLTYDDTDLTGKVFGGYRFNRGLAVEATYADLGRFEMNERIGTAFANTVLEIEALSIVVMGILPLNDRFELFAKAGVASWSMDETYTSNVFMDENNSYSGTEPVAGIGANFNVKRFTFSIQAERYKDIGDEVNTGVTDVDVLGVSARLNF